MSPTDRSAKKPTRVVAYVRVSTSRIGAASPPRFDRSKAGVIMELLRRQLQSPRYLQHSARVLFVVGQAPPAERAPILEAIFDLSRDEVVARVGSGKMPPSALAAHDYALDLAADGK